MSYERNVTITRRLYVSTCPKCGDRVEKEESTPKERLCNKCQNLGTI